METLKGCQMRERLVTRHPGQERINAYFQSRTSYWTDIYSATGVEAEIYRARRDTVLAWIDGLGLMPGARVLEIGCGAGFMAVALARRGFDVQAIDSASKMVERARQLAAAAGHATSIHVEAGDACALAFADGCFDLVLAIGLLPWLERPDAAMREMARVTRSGGYVLLTADNRRRLTHLLDPGYWIPPRVTAAKQRAGDMLRRLGLYHRPPREPMATFLTCAFVDHLLASVRLVKSRSITLGFGPLRLFGRAVLPEALGLALHRRLQHAADLGIPIIRSLGAQYLVLAVQSHRSPRVHAAGMRESTAKDDTRTPHN